MRERAVADLPDPDSPTSPSAPDSGISKLTSRTAATAPPGEGKRTFKCSTRTSGELMMEGSSSNLRPSAILGGFHHGLPRDGPMVVRELLAGKIPVPKVLAPGRPILRRLVLRRLVLRRNDAPENDVTGSQRRRAQRQGGGMAPEQIADQGDDAGAEFDGQERKDAEPQQASADNRKKEVDGLHFKHAGGKNQQLERRGRSEER